MFDLATIQASKKKIQEKRSDNSQDNYQEAFKILKEFTTTKDFDLLRKAGDNLVKSIEFNKEHFDSYICLSYIFHVLDNDEM